MQHPLLKNHNLLIVPQSIVSLRKALGLTPTATFLALTLFTHLNFKSSTTKTWISVSRMCIEADMRRGEIYRALEELKNHGYLTISKEEIPGRPTRNVYDLQRLIDTLNDFTSNPEKASFARKRNGKSKSRKPRTRPLEPLPMQ